MNIEEAIDILVPKENIDLSNHFNNTRFFEAIYTLLTAYEQKCNYIKENEIYKKNLFNNYEEKCKELEKEKEKNKELIFEKQELTSALLDSTPNDKIKAKIEEVEQWELYNMKIPRLSTLDERLGAKIGIKYVLQSLLEKE